MATPVATHDDPTTDSVGAVLADMLVAAGVRHFFLLTGGDNAFLGELLQRGVRMALARSERSAAYMADAYSRLTAAPAFAYGQFGPGATVLLSGLVDAFLASTPVVAIASEARLETLHRASYQEVDQQAMYRPLVKWSARVERGDRLPDLLRSAVRNAVVGCPGPTYLGVPTDLLLAPAGVSRDDRRIEPATASVPAYRSPASAEDITAVLEALHSAERPILLAGGGAMISAAFDELEALSESLEIPVLTTASGKGALAETHVLAMGVTGRYSRTYANTILRESDLVIAVGTRLNDMTTDRGRAIHPKATVVHIDVDPTAIGLNWTVAVPIVADAKLALGQLCAALDSEGPRLQARWKEWGARCDSLRSAWLDRRREVEIASTGPGPVSPVSVVAALRDRLEPDDIVVADTGYMAAWTSALYDTRQSGRTHLRTAGSLGWGLPASLGAQLAVGDSSRVICVIGDGGIGYHFTEIETAVRLGLPVVVVLMNNGTLAFEYQTQRKVLGVEHSELNDFGDSDYSAAARAFGAFAERVDSADALEPALDRALSSGEPALLDVRTDRDAPAPVTNFEHLEARPL